MNLDLNRALHDLAQDGAAHARIASPATVVSRRRHRRVVRRVAVGTVGLAVVGGLALAGTSLADHRADVPQPALTDPAPGPRPTPTPTTATPAALPGCGTTLPAPGPGEPTTLTATGPATAGVGDPLTVTVGLSGATGRLHTAPLRVLLTSGGQVVAVADVPDPAWTDTPGGLGLETEVQLDACGPLPAALTLVAAVPTTAGLVLSSGSPVVLTVAPPAGGGPTAAPLADPYVTRWDGESAITSDAPAGSGPLADGTYIAHVLSLDPAGTAVVDVGLFFGGADATAWAEANEPGLLGDVGVIAGYVLLNEVERPRTLTLAPDAVLTGYCVTEEGQMRMHATTSAELAAAPSSDAECVARSTLLASVPGASWFWIDIRGGVAVQVVGQYLP